MKFISIRQKKSISLETKMERCSINRKVKLSKNFGDFSIRKKNLSKRHSFRFEELRFDCFGTPDVENVARSEDFGNCAPFSTSSDRFSGVESIGEINFPRRSSDVDFKLFFHVDRAFLDSIRFEHEFGRGEETNSFAIRHWSPDEFFFRVETKKLFLSSVPRAFITVFRLFTKDEWFEIKQQMYALKINSIIIDIYVMCWLFFGGYILNPLLVGAMVFT